MRRLPVSLLVTASLLALAPTGRTQEGAPVASTTPALEWVTLQHPDGTTKRRTQARPTPDGPVLHGSHQVFHPDGRLAVEGHYEDGLPSGKWSGWYADGTPWLSGEFRDGRRSGRWELHHPNGQLAGVGSYLLGCRDRRWIYFDPEGVKDERESGLYRMQKEVHANREPHLRCETLGGVRHGSWTSWWPNGTVAAQGSFEHGRRDGEWSFWFQDGSFENGPPSGPYAQGMLLRDAPELPADPFAFPEERMLASAPEPDPGAIPRARRVPGLKAAERERIGTWIERYVASDDTERRKAELLLVQFGRDAIPDLLEVLRTADLESPQGRALAEGLHDRVLHEIAWRRGRLWPSGDDARVEQRRAILRWHAFWELTREDERFWRERPASTGGGLLSADLFDGSARALTQESVESPGDERSSELFQARRNARPQRNLRRCVDSGLSWLARHQGSGGEFGAESFRTRCDASEEESCGGTGNPSHDVGLTALATLAFLADGHTHLEGEHAGSVARALDWLLVQQDPGSGLIGPRQSHDFLYGHAIATLVLAELAQVTSDPDLHAALAAAVRVVLASRNPQGAWRYDWPPSGGEDTSVTAWMVSALVAAEAAGLPLADDVRAGAMRWLLAATETDTGRIGYDTAGAWSARIVGVNEHHPSDAGEAMTGAGLHALYLLGEVPGAFPEFAKSLELLEQKPPVWSADGLTNDLYYWFHAASALHQAGGKLDGRWRAQLESALLGSQRDEGEQQGSWDPNGPWGMIGGRVYSTALATLALQSDWREPRVRGGR